MLSMPQVHPADLLPAEASLGNADLLSSHILLGCFLREVSAPDQHLEIGGEQLILRLPRTGRALRVGLSRYSAGGAHRLSGQVEQTLDAEPTENVHSPSAHWQDVTLQELGDLLGAELAFRTGQQNEEFTAQLLASRDSLADIAISRPSQLPRNVEQPAADYLDSEQALLAGHPRHPSPKWRSGDPKQWREFSPETRTSFRLHWLAVPEELVLDLGENFDRHAAIEPVLAGLQLPEHHLALPVHPWQYRLLSEGAAGPALSAALASGALRDLGVGGLDFFPTASVRTLYQPEYDFFLKTSLNVRITNCLRKNADYELAGAVELTRVLAAPFASISALHPAFSVLPEPAARSVRLPEHLADASSRHALLEGTGVIVRQGIGSSLKQRERLHLAGTLAAVEPDPAGTQTRLADLAVLAGSRNKQDWARQWWQQYLEHLLPPVIQLWAEHGIVLEPHLQNVLVALGPDQLPTGVVLRDMEGTKLAQHRGSQLLAELSGGVAASARYDEERAWNRVAYCLFVNNLVEVAASLADVCYAEAPNAVQVEEQLWQDAKGIVARISAQLGHPEELQRVLAGAALPAKTNMLLRWGREADRRAGYAPFANPFRGGSEPTGTERERVELLKGGRG